MVSVFFGMELWMGLGWNHILDLAVCLLTHSSSLPPAGANGCAFSVWGNAW